MIRFSFVFLFVCALLLAHCVADIQGRGQRVDNHGPSDESHTEFQSPVSQTFPIPYASSDASSQYPHYKVGENQRALLQTGEGTREDEADFECSLQRRQIDQYLTRETRTWRVDDAVFGEIERNLQSIVNCTQPGDSILFDVTASIRPASRVTLPWRLTISSATEDIGREGGLFPETRKKTSFECPQKNHGVFLLRDGGALFANLLFKKCSFDGTGDPTGVVEVAACSSGSVRDSIRFHHVVFRKNRLIGSAGIRVQRPSCSVVEMVDVLFVKNKCQFTCGALLSTKNTLRDVVIEGNRLLGPAVEIPSMLRTPPGSETTAKGISASGNEVAAFHVVDSTLTLSDSIFSRNSANGSEASYPFSACIHLVKAVATVRRSGFAENQSTLGSVVYAEKSNLTLKSSNFTSNTSLKDGSCIAAVSSEVIMRDVLATGNRALRYGGVIAVKNRGILDASNSTFFQNTAAFGAVNALLKRCSGSFTNCRFSENRATQSGGVSFASEAQTSVHSCLFEHGNAQEGGYLTLAGSRAEITESSFFNGSASKGGCIVATENSFVDLQDGSMISCKGISGGAIYSYATDLSLQNFTLFRNMAENVAGGIAAANGGSLRARGVTFAQNSAKYGAAAYMQYRVKVEAVSCRMEQNWVGDDGGAWYIEQSNVTFDQCRFSENNARFGGSISIREGSLVDIRDTLMIHSMASRGGCVTGSVGSLLQMQNVTFQNCSASFSGGAMYLHSSAANLSNCSFLSNTAVDSGGAIFITGSELTGDRLLFENNSAISPAGSLAVSRGGGFSFQRESVVEISNSSMRNNSADWGGAMSAWKRSTGRFRSVRFSENSVPLVGGVGFAENSIFSIIDCHLSRNSAKAGGSFYFFRSVVNISQSLFTEGRANTSGGFLVGVGLTPVFMRNTTMREGRATIGGAVSLGKASIEEHLLHTSVASITDDGEAITGAGYPSVICHACMFEDNEATRGGAVYFETPNTITPNFQFEDGIVQNNSALYGGGFHFVSRGRSDDCSDLAVNCPLAAIAGSVFLENTASVVGGAILSISLKDIRIDCTSAADRHVPKFYTPEEWQSMNTADSFDAICPEWSGNKAELYGSAMASYATQVKKTIIHEGRTEMIEVIGDRYVFPNQRSGSPLPTVVLEVVDDLGQGPAVGLTNTTVSASMSSSAGYFSGSVTVRLNGGIGNFTRVIGFGSEGSYDLSIEFSEKLINNFLIVVHVRGCMIGETTVSNGAFCEPCNTDTFNFIPEGKTGCRSCPDNGDCDSHVIQPEKGYWHRTPCAEKIQKCISLAACGSTEREMILSEMTKDVEQCDFDEDYADDYTRAQCAEGHEGPLCGSCESTYGKSQALLCDKCFSSLYNAVLLLVSVLVLLCLASFTVRSNQTVAPQSGQEQEDRHQTTVSLSARHRSVTGNDQMAEMSAMGHVPREVMYTTQSTRTSPEQLANKTELAKWKAVEMFKVTAIALLINVNWTLTMITLFEAAEFISGVTSEVVIRSVDCLVPEGHSVERSIISTLVDALVPLFVICLFILFWFVVKTRNKESGKYLFNRIILSTFAVCYISYISTTKTLVNVLNCIEVHDSLDIAFDTTTEYWAVDTSIKCYQGSHAVLVGALAWPFLVLFTLGFPLIIACLLVTQVKPDYKEGRIYEVAGFLYRSYRKGFAFWESAIMLRKAVLAVIVVFSYPLGADLQQVMAGFVLALALYSQAVCRPFREEFDILNELEGLSMLVSLLTFLSSLFFNVDRVSHGVRVFITVGLLVFNLGLLLFFLTVFFVFSADYLRAVLEREAVPYEPELGTLHVLKVYLFDYTARKARDAIHSFARYIIDSCRQNQNP